jgi:hypothetical protein
MLCDVCLGVLHHGRNPIDLAPTNLLPEWKHFGHHRTLSSLNQSASRGCYVCNAIERRVFIFLQQPNRSLGRGSAQPKQVEAVEDNEANTTSQGDFFTGAALTYSSGSAVDGLEFWFMIRIIGEGHDGISDWGNICETWFLLRQTQGMLEFDDGWSSL